ncbi:transcriptional regulator [Streptomyces sp. NPDC020597]|uniref:transcriptional regulator n=1 Tax=unclassified Streptomyces TaxID=2593676 RepID=UPI0037AB7E00
MTAVRTTPPGTTPPPRLPVREKSAAQGQGGGLSPMLNRLAAERATGVLERERGSLYLAEGRVVHAESPLAPGLDVLLLTHGTLSPAVWQDAVERADEEYDVTRLLLDAGRVPRGALELCHLEAVFDAAYFALAPSSTPGRFHYGARHRLGALSPVPVGALERETLRRRALLDRLWPDPATDGSPLRRAETVASPAPTARQSAVLALADGIRTAPDIARELGRQAFHTLVDARRLAAAGLLTALFPPPGPHRLPTGFPPRHALPATGSPTAADPAAAAHAPGGPAAGPPTSGAPAAAGLPAPPVPGAPQGIALPRVNDPDITLLKRLRDALEAL